MNAAPVVHVVDDDPEFRSSLELLLNSVGIHVQAHASANEFVAELHESPNRPAMLLLDVRMPGMSGMGLLEHLRTEFPLVPVVMITGHGDIDMAVRAMKLGALDFITKPFRSQYLLDRVQEILSRTRDTSGSAPSTRAAATRLATLTAREREICDRIVCGDSNKAIAFDLGISIRTVESHRASIMEKMDARTVVELVRLALSANDTRDRYA